MMSKVPASLWGMAVNRSPWRKMNGCPACSGAACVSVYETIANPCIFAFRSATFSASSDISVAVTDL